MKWQFITLNHFTTFDSMLWNKIRSAVLSKNKKTDFYCFQFKLSPDFFIYFYYFFVYSNLLLPLLVSKLPPQKVQCQKKGFPAIQTEDLPYHKVHVLSTFSMPL